MYRYATRALSSCRKLSNAKLNPTLPDTSIRRFAVSSQSHFLAFSTMKIDSHVHVWDSDSLPASTDASSKIPASPEDLLTQMNQADVQLTILVQPIVYKFDHSYLKTSLQKHPTKFIGVGLLDLSSDAGTAVETVNSFAENGYRGLRINPSLLREGETLDGDKVIQVVQEAGKLGLVVNLFIKPEHFGAVDRLMAKCTSTDVMIDHFGFVKPDQESEFNKLLDLVKKYPRLCVKVSAVFRWSNHQQWPYRDVFRQVRKLVDTIGAQRVLWGSDFPFVTQECGYGKAVSVVQEMELNDAEKRWVLGNSAARLYKLQLDKE